MCETVHRSGRSVQLPGRRVGPQGADQQGFRRVLARRLLHRRPQRRGVEARHESGGRRRRPDIRALLLQREEARPHQTVRHDRHRARSVQVRADHRVSGQSHRRNRRPVRADRAGEHAQHRRSDPVGGARLPREVGADWSEGSRRDEAVRVAEADGGESERRGREIRVRG